jgi:glyoxylase-like metal-dependent hydrolase (beta-lactamase superfamily II)
VNTIKTIGISIGAMALAAPLSAQGNFDQVQITAEELAPGVAVLFGAGGNIAVSHGDDNTIMIDDQFAPLSAKIEAAVADLGAQPVSFVVNTHWHYDHTGGNEHFGETGATIFAHHNVRNRMAAGGVAAGHESPPAPQVALPIVTYDQGLRFHQNGDTIDLVFLGGGHTDGDSVVVWRDANVVHMGDLYFNIPSFPFVDVASGGNVYSLLNSLDVALAMMDDETQVIPGHGPMARKSDMNAYRAMIGESVSRVAALQQGGATLEEAIAAKPLAEFGRTDGFIGPDAFVTAIWQSIGDK